MQDAAVIPVDAGGVEEDVAKLTLHKVATVTLRVAETPQRRCLNGDGGGGRDHNGGAAGSCTELMPE